MVLFSFFYYFSSHVTFTDHSLLFDNLTNPSLRVSVIVKWDAQIEASPVTSAPSGSITQLINKKEKTVYIAERYKSFICSFDAAAGAPSSQGRAAFSLSSPRGSAVAGVVSCCGIPLCLDWWGPEARGAMRGDAIFLSLPNGASSFHFCFGRFSVGRCLYCGGDPCWRDEAAVMTTHRHKRSSSRPPPLSPPHSVSACYVLLLSISACFTLRHTHTHFPLILALTPASLPLHTLANTYTQAVPPTLPPWCPSLPSTTLLSNVAWWCHWQVQDAPCSICLRGRAFILHYVAVMGPDRGPPDCWVRGTEGPRPGTGGGKGLVWGRRVVHRGRQK